MITSTHHSKKRRKVNTRKKSVIDILFWCVMAFVLIVGFVVIKYAWSEMYTGLQNSNLYSEHAQENLDVVNSQFIPLMDSYYVMVIIGVMIATIIGAFALRTHPAFWLIAFIVTMIELIIAAPLANAYTDQISQHAALAATASTFTVSQYIMIYLPLWVFIFNALVAIVAYGLGRTESV